MPSIQLKTAAFAPMPSVRQRIARMENPGLRRRMLRPKRTSCRKLSIKLSLRASRHSSFACSIPPSERKAACRASFGFSLCDIFVNLVLQMKLELLAEVQLSLVLVKNRPQAKRQFVIPTHVFAPYGVSNTNSMAKESRFHCACSWRRYFVPSGVSE